MESQQIYIMNSQEPPQLEDIKRDFSSDMFEEVSENKCSEIKKEIVEDSEDTCQTTDEDEQDRGHDFNDTKKNPILKVRLSRLNSKFKDLAAISQKESAELNSLRLTCDYCPKTYKYARGLRRHVKKVHRRKILISNTLPTNSTQVNRPNNSHIRKSFVQDANKLEVPGLKVNVEKVRKIVSMLKEICKDIDKSTDQSNIVSKLKELASISSSLNALSSSMLEACNNGTQYDQQSSVVSPMFQPFDESVEMETFNSIDNNSVESANFYEESSNSIQVKKVEPDNFSNSYLSNMELNLMSSTLQEVNECEADEEDKGFKVEHYQNTSENDIEKPGRNDLSKDKVVVHSSKIEDKRRFCCALCQKTFASLENVKRHLKVHLGLRPYKCPKCSKSFSRGTSLKRHMGTHQEEKPFTCTQCSYAGKSADNLKSHLMKHLQDRVLPCPHCFKKFMSEPGRKNHIALCHKPKKCSLCDVKCMSQQELRKHMLTHESLKCSICPELVFTSWEAFYTHNRRHRKKSYFCELCGYSCHNLTRFRYHELRHKNKTPFHCPDCDYKCSSPTSYKTHRLKHDGRKPYLCYVCGASFGNSSYLKTHMLIHQGLKPYKCSVCGYRCRTSFNLKEHEMSHTGDKPFKCALCSFSCRRKKELQNHLLSKHGTKSVDATSMLLPAALAAT